MDINKIGQIGKIGKIETGGVIKGKEKGVIEGNDTLSISPAGKRAQEMDYLKSLAFNVISNIPNVRSDKIEIATNRIKEGYYNKNVSDIANALLNPPI